MPRPQRRKKKSQSMPRGEINIESIRALEKQVQEHEMAIVKLKRTRNLLLNVSTLPPEVLGNIFCWNVIDEDDFGGLKEGSYNFLLVCHHWFEVASRTPELWSSWGNDLGDWKKRSSRYPTAPLDLVLRERTFDGRTLDRALRGALQDRAARDTIRRVHLHSRNSKFLGSIISSLTVNCEEIQSSSVESLILLDEDQFTPVDVSDFFACYRFPKLRRLKLVRCKISSWDLMMSRTSALTTLILHFHRSSPTPTTSQLLSILTSNPSLREISLSSRVVPNDGGGKSSIRVPLHHLRQLNLTGDLRRVFALLHQLDHPRNMDSLAINLYDCTVEDVSQIVGPYLRDYLQRRDRSQNGLGLHLSTDDLIALDVGDVGGIDFSACAPGEMNKFMAVSITLDQVLPQDLLEETTVDLISNIPREEIVYFRAYDEHTVMGDISAQFPHLKTLHLVGVPLSAAFPKPTLDNHGKILPSLQHITLDWVVVHNGDWDLLKNFLSSRAFSGSEVDTLEIIGSYDMHPRIFRSIEGKVRKFRAPRASSY